MAINGTWVGSSAKSETGKEWMSQAGSEVKVGTPFWMSSLIGKSVMRGEMVSIGTRTISGQQWRGLANYGGTMGSLMSGTGRIYGSRYDLRGHDQLWGVSDYAILKFENNINRSNVKLKIDGTLYNFDWNNSLQLFQAVPTNNLGYYLKGKVNQIITIEVVS